MKIGILTLSGLMVLSHIAAGQERVTSGLQVLYTFQEGSGTLVSDVSGVGNAMNLTVDNPSNVAWVSGGGLRVEANSTESGFVTIGTTGPATKIINAAQSTNEITLEAWVAAGRLNQRGPARIVTLSGNGLNRNTTLGHNYNSTTATYQYVARLRTDDVSVNENGLPDLLSDSYSDLAVHHIVYTRASDGSEQLYVDGVVVSQGSRPGTFNNWTPSYQFALANEFGGDDRPYEGTYYLVAVYNQALTGAEVSQNYTAGYTPPVVVDPPTTDPGYDFSDYYTPTDPNYVANSNGETRGADSHIKGDLSASAYTYGSPSGGWLEFDERLATEADPFFPERLIVELSGGAYRQFGKETYYIDVRDRLDVIVKEEDGGVSGAQLRVYDTGNNGKNRYVVGIYISGGAWHAINVRARSLSHNKWLKVTKYNLEGGDLPAELAYRTNRKSFASYPYYYNQLAIGSAALPSGYQLAVDGKAVMEEVKIQVVEGADFVFEDDYDLPSLESVENHIRSHQHLPDIPSARQMQEEGLGLGEMNIRLLQKVEELTLYLIDQNKEIERMKAEIAELKK